MARSLSSQVLETVEKAPVFQLKGVDGKMYSLDDFNSKSVPADRLDKKLIAL